jgi:hypothetical protein
MSGWLVKKGRAEFRPQNHCTFVGDMGNHYVETDLLRPILDEIREARPIAEVLPPDCVGARHSSRSNHLRRHVGKQHPLTARIDRIKMLLRVLYPILAYKCLCISASSLLMFSRNCSCPKKSWTPLKKSGILRVSLTEMTSTARKCFCSIDAIRSRRGRFLAITQSKLQVSCWEFRNE